MTLSGAYKFSGATPTELGYLSGVTSAIQTQLNGKLASSGGTITGSISCTGLTDSGTITSSKSGINLGTNNVPAHYLDIVVPTASTSYALNVSNTFGGAPLAFIDSSGNVVFQAVNCVQVNTAYGIILPTNYLTAPQAAFMGYVKPETTLPTQALTTATLTNMDSLSLTQGVWDIRAVVIFQTASGTNTGVSMVSAMLSTSSTLNDNQLAFHRMPVVGFSFGASQDVSAYVPVTRIYSCIGAAQTVYLNVKATFTGSLSCVSPVISACRVA